MVTLFKPLSTSPNESVALTWQVTNTGNATTNSGWYDRVYLSTDTTVSADDISVGDFYNSPILGLGAGQSYSRTANVTIPTRAGLENRYLLVVADGYFYQLESNDNNNNNATAIPLTIQYPDLIITTANAPSQISSASGTVNLNWTVTNQGVGKALNYWYDYVYLSNDDKLDSGDIYLGQQYVSPRLETNQSYTSTQTINIPGNISAGNKYLIFSTNASAGYSGYLPESDLANNIFVKAVSIVTPDLAISNATAPSTAVVSETIQVSWDVSNPTDASALSGRWYDRVYLSTDNIWDANDRDITSYNYYGYNGKPLDAHGTATNFTNVTLPSTFGNYYLFVVTDAYNYQSETDETNNISNAIPISITAPNLTITATTPSTATLSQPFAVSWTVTNASDSKAIIPWNDLVYISDDNTLDSNDRLLTTYNRTNSTPLAGRESYTVNQNFTLDSNSLIGNKYLIFTTNKTSYFNGGNPQTETSYSDNLIVVPISINAPDLKAESIASTQTAAEFDTAIDVNWVVSNLGAGKATGNWEDRIYLSKDRVLSDDDIKLGTQLQNITNLASTDTYQSSSSVLLTYPQPRSVDANGYFSEVESNDTFDTANDLRLNFLETGTNKYTAKVKGDGYYPSNYNIDYFRFDASPGDTVKIQVTNNSYYSYLYLYDRNGNVLASSSGYGYGGVPSINYTLSASNYTGAYYVFPSIYYSNYQLNVELQTTKLIQPQPPEAGEYYLILKADAKDGLLEGKDLNSNIVASVAPINITYANRRPDLTIAGTLSQSNVSTGGTIPIGWTVTNQSTIDPAIGSWNDYVYLSDDNILDSSDIFLSSQTHSGLGNSLAAGANYHVDSSVKLPNNISGNKYLLFVTDRNNNSIETDETNNVNAVAISIGIPDLKIEATATAPTTASIDGVTNFAWTVTNVSSSGTNGLWKDRVYLSNDNILDTGDTYLAELASPVNSLQPNGKYQQNYNLSLTDPNLVGTKKYLIIVNNPDGQLLETDRTNNTITLPIDLTAPNLQLTGIDAPDVIGSNRTINVTLTGINNGTATIDAGSWYDGLYLSRDRFLSNDDLQLSSAAKYLTVPLKVGDSYSQTIATTIPDIIAPGAYYLIGYADLNNNRRESIETDNSIFKQIQIGLKSDLVVSAVSAPPLIVNGGQISIDWTVLNQGTADALTSWTDSIYLSDNNLLDGSDLLLATKASLNTLTVDNRYTSSQTITLPTQAIGNKYIIVRTNSTGSQSESNGNNNYSFVPISIQALDLSISQLTAPTLAQLGDKVTVTWKVTNNSSLDAVNGWNDGIYISKDNVLDSSDTLLTTVSKPNLIGGSNYTATADITIPDLPPGNYYLIAKTDKDSQQLETDETNNTVFAPIQLKYPPYTDLVVDTINTPATATSGEAVALTWRVSNQGQLATNSTSWTDRVYISTKNTFDNTAISLGTIDHTGKLNSGENYLQTSTFNLPNGISGSYYTFVTTDINNQVGEYKFEGNNTTTSSQSIAVTRKPDPDLVVTNLTYAGTGQPGQTIQVNWTVNNTGLGIAKGNWNDRVYLTNSTGTVNIPLQIKAAPTNLLELGGSYTNSATITLPTNLADGNYQIAVVTNADNTIFEGDGVGNDRYTGGQITSGHPDLAVTVDPIPLSATSGTTIPINWTVQNIGTAVTLANWQDRVYLSSTATFDGNARLVGTFDRSSLAVNGSYNGQLNLTLPIDLQGRQYLFIQTDAGQVLNELGSKVNNLTSLPIDITLAPYADLVVSNVTAPDLLVRDPAQLDVSWTVSNQGTGTGITNNWIDRVILVGQGKEITVGEFAHTGNLAVGDNYTRTESISLPAALTGKYQVFVRSDATNLVFENGSEGNNYTQANNNLTVSPIPYADLVLSNLQLNGTANSGKSINISWQVDNQGIGPTNTDTLNEHIYLTTDPQGRNIIQQFDFQHLGQVSVGAFYERAVDVNLVNGLSGNYYLIVNVGGAFELDKTANNTQIIPIQIALTPAPDLVVKSITAPTNLQSGDRFDLTWEVKNDGTGNTDSNWVDTVYLQEIGKPENLIALQNYTYNRILESGKSYSRTESFKLNDTIQGQYQVLVKTNSSGGLYEASLTNNSNSSAPVQIVYPTRPDLIVDEIISPDIVDAGGKITVEIVIKNQGTSNANGSWNDLIYLSSDDKIDGGDTLLGSFENITALTPGSKYRIKADSVTVPKYLRGNAFIIVKTDASNSISEIPHEDNNTLYKYIAINDIKPADLVTSNVIVPEQAFAGSSVDVRYRVTNLGVAETNRDSWTDSIWLAPGKNLQSLAASGSAIKLTDLGHTGSLKVGESYEATVRVTLPKGINGQYFLTPWSDTYDVVLEDIYDINKNPDDPNEVDNNNYKAAQINVLNLPSFVLLPDIAVSDVTSTPQKVAGSTDILNVSWKETNIGINNTTVGSWQDVIYLADASTLSAATKYWAVGIVAHQGDLGIGESYTGSFSQQVAPTMVGKYVIVESIFGDPNPANNVNSGATDINTILPADLVVSSVTTNPTSFSNETVNVSWTVKNQGANVWDGTKYWYDEVWFSADPTFIKNRATLVGSFLHDNVQSLAGGASYTNNANFTLPAGIDGKYYFYVSTDYGYRTDRGPRSLGNLGEPNPQGQYPQFTTQVFENSSNNLNSTNFQAIYREPDLQVTQVKDPGVLTAGSKISLDWQVSNLGGRATRELEWRDAVFLSKDKSLDASDLLLSTSYRDGSLNVGGSYDLKSTATLPIDLMVGDYYLLFGTDLPKIPQSLYEYALTVPEFKDEGNNIKAQAVTIVAPILPDLKVTNITVPVRGTAGQGLELSYTVNNQGNSATKVVVVPNPLTPLVLPTLWSDNVYLSKDRFLDTTIDRYIGSIDQTSNLAAGGSYTVTQQLNLPKDLTGAYYLFVVADGGNVIYEGSQELNNALESTQPILIDLPPAADLRVENIVIPTGGKSGESAQISWTVANRAINSAKGSWSDVVYLSSDANWDIKDRVLGRVIHSGDLAQDATYTSTLTTNLPALTPGQYRIIVRTDAQNQVYEGDNEVNNLTTAATPINLSATELPLNQILTTTLTTGQERLYHLVLPKGETLKVSLNGNLTAQNEIFIRYGQAPTSAEYDATYSGITNGNPTAIIPGSQAGDYYILVKGQATATIKAELLSFGITDVVTDRGGDGKYVTAQILGAKFQAGAIVKLIRPGIEEVLPVNVQTIDSTRITAIFDFTNVTHGLYDIKVLNPDGNESILPYRYQVEQAITPDVTVGLTGKRVLDLEEFATYGISVKSISNLDAPYVQFQYGLPALGNNYKLGIPYTPSNTNLRGNPSNSLTDMPWATLTSDLNTNGEILSTGYIYDFPTGGYIGQNVNFQVYPDILTKFPGINDDYIYLKSYAKYYPSVINTFAKMRG
jgi:large repetitive protein